MSTSDTTIERDVERLSGLARAGHTCISIVSEEEPHALQIAKHTAQDLDLPVVAWTAVKGLYDPTLEGGRSVRDTENLAAALLYVARQRTPSLVILMDAAPHLDDAVTARSARELVHLFDEIGGRLLLIDPSPELPPAIASIAARFDVSMPDEAELEAIVRRTVRGEHRKSPLDVRISERKLQVFVRNLRGLTRRQAEMAILETVADDRRLDEEDLNTVLAAKRRLLASDGVLDYIEAPIDLEQIAGLRTLKKWLHDRQNAFSDEAQAYGLAAPRGVLMLGVQGTGKSLTAKAIASAWKRPLLRLDAGALYDRYIGESEKRLRSALRQAEAMSPVILWIDEIEKAFASAASTSNDGGLSRRMFGALLTWMQEHRSPVFLVATANDIEALPPELLRKGRFDEIFFVDLPGESVRREVLAIHLKKRDHDPKGFDLDRLAQVSDGFSPAELEQAVISAMHGAFAHNGDLSTGAIERVIRESPPLAVTARERVAALRRWAEDRCVPADEDRAGALA